jgi:hypothetical protein
MDVGWDFSFTLGSKAFLYKHILFSLLLEFHNFCSLGSFPKLGSVVNSEKEQAYT